MPAIHRQKATTTSRPNVNGAVNTALKFEAGSVLSKAIAASDIQDSWIKMILYGGNGIGKTTLAATFEKPLLHIALERNYTGGARSIRKVPGVTVVRPGADDWDSPIDSAKCVDETFRLVDELNRKNPFKSVVFDHVTVFQEHVLEKITGRPTPVQNSFGKVSGDEYTERAEKVKVYLLPWLELKCDTVFVGKEKDHNPPKEERINPKTGKLQPDMRPRFLRGMQSESFVSVDLGGSAVGWLQDACDFACRLYMDKEIERVESTVGGQKFVDYKETGKFVRALRVGYHPNFFSRFRSDVPEKVPESIPYPTYAKIVAAINGTYDESMSSK